MRDFAELVRWNNFMELFFLAVPCEFVNEGPNSGAKTFRWIVHWNSPKLVRDYAGFEMSVQD
jgi:hypothetical protein